MTRIGIFGYGNLARGAECAIRQNPDMELAAVFTRRDPSSVAVRTPGVPVVAPGELITKKHLAYLNKIGYNMRERVRVLFR